MESKRSIRKGIKRNLIKSITVESDMGKVWTFGDSLTERYNPTFEWSRDYIQWKGYLPKVYGNFLSEKLGYELENLGKAGSDNYTIFEAFCKGYPLMEDNDVIVIGWSCYLRFRMANQWDGWSTLIPNFENYLDNHQLSKSAINEILINRDNVRYVEEVNNWIKFINYLCRNKKVIHWTGFQIDKKYNRGSYNCFTFGEMERIDTETNGIVNDSHFSESGHEKLAEELIEIIIENKTPKQIIRLI